MGVERVREAVGKGTLRLAVVAPDASHHSLHKVRPLLAARGVPTIDAPSAIALGRAVGREATVVVGVTDVHLARGIRQAHAGQHAAEYARPHARQQDQGVDSDATDAPDRGRDGTVPRRGAQTGRPRGDFRRMD